jgi:hypothetical protein
MTPPREGTIIGVRPRHAPTARELATATLREYNQYVGALAGYSPALERLA